MGHHWRQYLAICVLCANAKSIRAEDTKLPVNVQAAMAIGDQVRASLSAGKTQQALELSEKLIASVERDCQDYPKVAGRLLSLAAVAYLELHRYVDAEKVCDRALPLLVQHYGPNHSSVALVLVNLGNSYRGQQRYKQAVAAHQRALQIIEKNPQADSGELALVLENIGVSCRLLGRYVAAESYLKRCVLLQTKLHGPQHLDVARAYLNLGFVYSSQDQLAKAHDYFQYCLKMSEAIAGPNDPSLYYVLTKLGHVHEQWDNYDKAVQFQRRAQKIYLAARGPDDILVAGDYNLARLYCKQRKFEEAEPIFSRALKALEKHYGPQSPQVAFLLGEMGQFYAIMGRADAEEYADRALQIATQGSLRDLMTTYHSRIVTRATLGNFAGALDDLKRTLELAELRRASLSGGDHERAESFAAAKGEYDLAAACQFALGNFPQSLALLEQAASRTLIDQMRLAGVDLLGQLPKDDAQALRKALEQALAQSTAIQNQLRATLKNPALSAQQRREKSEKLQDQLDRAQSFLREVDATIRNTSPAYRQAISKNSEPVELATLQSWLRSRKMLMLYYASGNEYDRYVLSLGRSDGELARTILSITPGRATALGLGDAEHRAPEPWFARLLGLEPNDNGAIHLVNVERAGFFPNLSNPLFDLGKPNRDEQPEDSRRRGKRGFEVLASDEPRSSESARLAALYELLIPAKDRADLVAGKYDCLCIIATGRLAQFPFEALIVESGDRPTYLLDAGPPIIYAPSATVLLNLAERLPAEKTARSVVLTVGNPTYQQKPDSSKVGQHAANAQEFYEGSSGQLLPLPHTEVESNWVKEVFSKQGVGVTQLLGLRATEANVRKQISGRQVVHLACHGMADNTDGNLFAALALTPGTGQPAGAGDDGFLTLAEIYDLKLSGCELAVLSACETNAGAAQRGEGLWAITRGFLVAGARRVVASNWLVDDEAGASLISYFASGVAKQTQDQDVLDYAKALQAAKRLVRNQKKWQSPFYWAPFVLVGPN